MTEAVWIQLIPPGAGAPIELAGYRSTKDGSFVGRRRLFKTLEDAVEWGQKTSDRVVVSVHGVTWSVGRTAIDGKRSASSRDLEQMAEVVSVEFARAAAEAARYADSADWYLAFQITADRSGQRALAATLSEAGFSNETRRLTDDEVVVRIDFAAKSRWDVRRRLIPAVEDALRTAGRPEVRRIRVGHHEVGLASYIARSDLWPALE